MAEFTRVSGAGFYEAGTLYSTSQIDAYLITVKNTDGNAQDLRTEDGVEEVIEYLMREISPLMYFVTDDNSGTVHVITDNHHNDAATLQARIRNMGTVNSIDISGTDVALGGAIAVTGGDPVQTGD